MKHVADISAEGRHVSRTFRLPLVSEFENAATLTVPPMPTAWHKLPERFLDGLDFASRFVGRRHSSLHEWVWRAHFDNGKVYATDEETLVEYDAGPSDAPYLSHGKRAVALLKAFGPPLESAVEKDAGGCAFIHYKWDGKRLRLPAHYGENPAEKLLIMLDAFDWTGLHPVSARWKDQIAGHFNFKMARHSVAYSCHGLFHVASDRIVGGSYDDEFTTELRIATHAEVDVSLNKDAFLRVLRVADEIKFSHREDQHRLLFRGDHVRGILVAHRPKDPIPELTA